MLPSAFVFLDALPLTPNGKVDRGALPAPDHVRPELERDFVAPRTPVEVKLAEIWADVLRLEQVGIHDNFFELGGHSLLATQVISGVRDAFQVEIPLRRLFEWPTVAGLAEQLVAARERPQNGRAASAIPSLGDSAGQGPSPCHLPSSGCGSWTSSSPTVRLQHPGRVPPGGSAGRESAGTRHQRGRAPSRGAAHHVRRGGRGAGADHRAVAACAAAGGDLGSAGRERESGSARGWLSRRRIRPFDLSQGPACCAPNCCG